MSDLVKSLMGSTIDPVASVLFLTKLKTADAKADMNAAAAHGNGPGYQPPDTTGVLEGEFTVPVAQVLALMTQQAEGEFKTMFAYKVYANTLRDLSHHSIAEEFEDHASDELEHADFLLRRMTVLGGAVQMPDIEAPPASTDAVDIIRTMIRLEQEGMAKWRMLHSVLGENPTKYKVEEYLTKEQEHLDELMQLLPPEARVVPPEMPAQAPPATEAPPPAVSTAPPATPSPAKETPEAKTASLQDLIVKAARAALQPAKAEHLEKARERADANLTAKARVHEGSRGELYGDLVGRLTGGAGGAFAGRKGSPIAQVAAAALGQHLGGKVGRLAGREVDVHKHAFDDNLNMLAMEQQAEEAQAQNEAAYYKQLAQANGQAKAQLEQQAQAQAQQLEQLQAQQSQLQATLQQASDATTTALTQSVQATQAAIQQRQQAADVSISLDSLKQQLRELADGGGSPGGPGDITGGAASGQVAGGPPGASVGEGAQQPGAAPPTTQEGPAADAAGASSAPGTPTPEGSAQPQAPSSPSPSGSQGTTTPASSSDSGDRPQVHVKVSSAAKALLSGALKRAPYAAAGALGAGAMHQGMTRSPIDALRAEAAEAGTNDGTFGAAMQEAQLKARLAFRELAEEHPGASLGMSMLAGGTLGAVQGPAVAQKFKGIGKNIKYLMHG